MDIPALEHKGLAARKDRIRGKLYDLTESLLMLRRLAKVMENMMDNGEFTTVAETLQEFMAREYQAHEAAHQLEVSFVAAMTLREEVINNLTADFNNPKETA